MRASFFFLFLLYPLIHAPQSTVDVYAIRGAEGKEFECDEELKDIEKALKSTGLRRFSLIRKDAVSPVKGSELVMELPKDCKARVLVEDVTKGGDVRIRVKVVQQVDRVKKTLIDTKSILKKPLIIRLMRLDGGYLLLAINLR